MKIKFKRQSDLWFIFVLMFIIYMIFSSEITLYKIIEELINTLLMCLIDYKIKMYFQHNKN